MKGLLSWILCWIIGLTCVSSSTIDIFEFGDDDRLGHITFNQAGIIEKKSLLTKIPITVPPCMMLTYVRVEVDNEVSPPYVSLDKRLMTVTIKYRGSQYPYSRYLVTAKAKPMNNCLRANIELWAE